MAAVSTRSVRLTRCPRPLSAATRSWHGESLRSGRRGSCCGRPFAKRRIRVCLIPSCRLRESIGAGDRVPYAAIQPVLRIPQETRIGHASVDPSPAGMPGSFPRCARDTSASLLGCVSVRSSSSSSSGTRDRRSSAGSRRCGAARDLHQYLLRMLWDQRARLYRGGVRSKHVGTYRL